MSRIMKDNGVKLLAAVMVLAVALAGVVFLSDATDATEETAPSVSVNLPNYFVVGVATEFSVSTIAGNMAGTLVVGTGIFDGSNVKLEYYEVKDGNWYVLNGEFGPSSGFPLSDATSLFRVTFNEAWEGTVNIQMKAVLNDEIVCQTGDKNIVAAVAAIGEKGYTSLADAINDANGDSPITLLTDIVLENTLEINKGITINLNEKKVTSTNSIFKVMADGVTINGGSLVMNYDGSTGYCAVTVKAVYSDGKYSPSSLTMENVNVESTKYGAGVFGINTGDSNKDGYSPQMKDVSITDKTVFYSTLTLTNCVIKSDAGGFATNGGNGFENIIVNGGSITSEGCAFYLPSNAKTTVNNCIIKGESGFDQRAGILEINGGSITYTGPGETKEAGDGPVSFGTAIQIVDADGYSHADSITNISGTQIKAEGDNTFGDICFGFNRNNKTALSIDAIKTQTSTSYRNATLIVDGLMFEIKKNAEIGTTYLTSEELKVGKGTTLTITEDYYLDGTCNNYGNILTGSKSGLVLNKNSTYNGYDGSIFRGTLYGPGKTNSLVGSLVGDSENATAGISVTGGSLIINGKIITETGTEAGVDITISGDSIQISGAIEENTIVQVTAGTVVTVPERATLTIGNNAVLAVEGKSSFVNDGTVIIPDASSLENSAGSIVASSQSEFVPGKIVNSDDEDDYEIVYPEYEEGAKVTVKGITYTVYKNTLGDITLQYGLSCGDIYYSGLPVDEKDVTLLSTSLTTGYKLTNQSFSLADGSCVKAGSYEDVLKVQLTFSGLDGNITANKSVDLVILKKPLSMDVDVPEGSVFGNVVADFQDVSVSLNETIVLSGNVGYYNLGTGLMTKPGYYLTLNFSFDGAIGNDIYKFKVNGEDYILSDGSYLIYLGATEVVARGVLDDITFSVEIGDNYLPASYKVDSSVLTFEVPLVVTDGNPSLHGSEFAITSLSVVDVAVSTELKWSPSIEDSVNSDKTSGWFLGLKFGSSPLSGYKAVVTIGDEEYDINAFDGNLLIRQDNSNITIVITDGNGLKTRYTVDTSDVDFEIKTGYGETKAEVEAQLADLGVTIEAKDVADKTMFMIFNTKGNTSLKATATSENDESKYYEEGLNGYSAGCIWYFSFNDKASGQGVPGPYEMVIKNEDKEVIASGFATMKGVFSIDQGYSDNAADVISDVQEKTGRVLTDVQPNTFYWIIKVYGYNTLPADDETKLKVHASISGGSNILKAGNEFDVPHAIDGEDHAWVLYYSFDNPAQVEGGKIPGVYTMTLLSGDVPIATSADITVGSDVVATFGNYTGTDVGTYVLSVGYGVTPSDGKNVQVTGTIKPTTTGYYVPLNITGNYLGTITVNGVVYTSVDANNNYLISVDKGTTSFDVKFAGEGVYRETVYKVTVNATYQTALYDIILVDGDYYGEDGFKYDTKEIGQGIILPNGPAVGKEFKGWKVDGIDAEKYFAAGSLMVVSEDIIVDGKITLKAIYRGDMQRTNFNMEIDVNDGELTIKVDSSEGDGYRNLTANHYYVINIVDSNMKNIYSKVIASSTILNGGDVYSETITKDIDGLGAGCSVSVKFAADYAPGMEPLAKAFYSVPSGKVQDAGYVEDKAIAASDINAALAEIDPQKSINVETVADKTMYIVYETDIVGQEMTGTLSYIDNGVRKYVYVESFTFPEGSSSAHVWYFSFAENEPSHVQDDGVVLPLDADEQYNPAKQYILNITCGETVVAHYVI